MWQLHCVFFVLIPKAFVVSGLVRGYGGDSVDNFLEINTHTGSHRTEVNGGQKDPLWILRLGNDDFDNLMLRAASQDEEQDFYYAFVPLIKRLEERKGPLPKPTRKVQIPHIPILETERLQNKALKNDIMKIVNKFALSTNKEPDVYLNESDDVSSLALYFKGPYTSLIVTLGNKQWHYFLTPSPFPAWFYETHAKVQRNEKEIYIDVPAILHSEFYKVLLNIIHVFLGFPI